MKLRTIAIAAAIVFAATPAAAQERLKLTSSGSVTKFGYYVGPYQGMILSDPTRPTIDLYCVDFLHHISVGQQWHANFTFLGDGADLSTTRGGGLSDALDRYRKAAWLSTRFAATSTSQWGDIHATIWRLFTGAGPNPSTGSYWLDQANANYLDSGLNYEYFAVVTDVNLSDPNGAQEFITVVTPEPSTYLLMGTGILFVLALGYYRRCLG